MKNFLIIILSLIWINTIVNGKTRPEVYHEHKVRYFKDENLKDHLGKHSFYVSKQSYDPRTNRYEEGDIRDREKGGDSPEKKSYQQSNRYEIDLPNIPGLPNGLSYVLIILLLIGVAFLIFHLAGGSFSSTLSRDSDSNEFDEQEYQNIHEIDFEQQINQAIAEGRYNDAARLHFLLSLKNLNDKNFIDWQINKTNRDYYYEIKKRNLKKTFKELSLIFEYLVYGDFDISKDHFDQIHTLHMQFDADIKK